MESEFIKDLNDLEVAFKMHVDEKEDERSIIVVGHDDDQTHIYMYGRNDILYNSLLSAMLNCDDRVWMNTIVHEYEKEALTYRDGKFLLAGTLMKVLVMLCGLVTIALWYFIDLSAITTITNLLLIAYTLIYIHFTSVDTWKKARNEKNLGKGKTD